MTKHTYKIGTRTSDLALAQTRLLVDALEERGADFDVDIVSKQSLGDQRPEEDLSDLPGKGFFTEDLDRAVATGELDAAVHSAKDVPTDNPADLTEQAYLKRENASDVFVGHHHERPEDLPSGAVIGTGSPRRACQIRRLRSDLQLQEIRGNVDTRIRKLRDSSTPFDGIILAAAGLKRLNLELKHDTAFPITQFVPAPAQGAIVVQTRNDDESPFINALREVDHTDTRFQVETEREILQNLGGGCRIPLGIHCQQYDRSRFQIHAFVGSDDPDTFIHERTDQFQRENRKDVLNSMIGTLKNRGADEYLKRARDASEQ